MTTAADILILIQQQGAQQATQELKAMGGAAASAATSFNALTNALKNFDKSLPFSNAAKLTSTLQTLGPQMNQAMSQVNNSANSMFSSMGKVNNAFASTAAQSRAASIQMVSDAKHRTSQLKAADIQTLGNAKAMSTATIALANSAVAARRASDSALLAQQRATNIATLADAKTKASGLLSNQKVSDLQMIANAKATATALAAQQQATNIQIVSNAKIGASSSLTQQRVASVQALSAAKATASGLLNTQQITNTTSLTNARVGAASLLAQQRATDIGMVAQARAAGMQLIASTRQTIRETTQGFQQMGRQVGAVGTQISQSFRQMGNSVAYAGFEMRSAGIMLTLGLTAPLLAVATTATKMSMDFETATTKMITLANESQQQVASWKGELLGLAGALGKTPKELAEGLYYVTSSGIQTSKAMDTMVAAAKGSAIGLGSTATVADLATSVMNAYGQENINAGQAVGVLLAAVQEGKGEATAFASSLGRVLPIAAEMGVSFNDTAAAVASLTRQGLSADLAVTGLRAVLTTILSPTKQALEALHNVGLSASGLRQQLREKGLIATLHTMRDAFGDNITELRKVEPNVRALTATLNLTGASAAETDKVFARLAHSGNAALAAAFKITAEMTEFKLNQALANLQSKLIKIGDVLKPYLIPILTELSTWLNKITYVFTSLSPGVQDFIIKSLALTAAIGPIIAVIGGVVLIIGALIGSLGAIAAALGTTIGSVLAFVSGIGIAAAALVAAGLYIIANWDEVYEAAIRTWNGILDYIAEVAVSLIPVVGPPIMGLITIFQELYNNIVPIVGDIVNYLSQKFDEAMNYIGQVLQVVASEAPGILGTMFSTAVSIISAIIGIIENLWNIVSPTLGRIVQGIIDVFNYMNPIVVSAITFIYETVVSIFGGLVTAIVYIFEKLAPALIPILATIIVVVSGIVGGIIDAFIYLYETLGPIISGFVEFMVSAFEWAAPKIINAISIIGETLEPVFEAVDAAITFMVDHAKEGMMLLAGAALLPLAPIITLGAAIAWATGNFDRAKDAFKGFIDETMAKIKDMEATLSGFTTSAHSNLAQTEIDFNRLSSAAYGAAAAMHAYAQGSYGQPDNVEDPVTPGRVPFKYSNSMPDFQKIIDDLKYTPPAMANFPDPTDKAGRAKTALNELGISVDELRKAMDLLNMSAEEQTAVLLKLGVKAEEAHPNIYGLSMTVEQLAAAFNKAGLNGTEFANRINNIQNAKKAIDEVKKALQEMGVSVDQVKSALKILNFNSDEMREVLLKLGVTAIEAGEDIYGLSINVDQLAAALNKAGLNGAELAAKMNLIQAEKKAIEEAKKAAEEMKQATDALESAEKSAADAAKAYRMELKALADTALNEVKPAFEKLFSALDGGLSKGQVSALAASATSLLLDGTRYGNGAVTGNLPTMAKGKNRILSVVSDKAAAAAAATSAREGAGLPAPEKSPMEVNQPAIDAAKETEKAISKSTEALREQRNALTENYKKAVNDVNQILGELIKKQAELALAHSRGTIVFKESAETLKIAANNMVTTAITGGNMANAVGLARNSLDTMRESLQYLTGAEREQMEMSIKAAEALLEKAAAAGNDVEAQRQYAAAINIVTESMDRSLQKADQLKKANKDAIVSGIMDSVNQRLPNAAAGVMRSYDDVQRKQWADSLKKALEDGAEAIEKALKAGDLEGAKKLSEQLRPTAEAYNRATGNTAEGAITKGLTERFTVGPTGESGSANILETIKKSRDKFIKDQWIKGLEKNVEEAGKAINAALEAGDEEGARKLAEQSRGVLDAWYEATSKSLEELNKEAAELIKKDSAARSAEIGEAMQNYMKTYGKFFGPGSENLNVGRTQQDVNVENWKLSEEQHRSFEKLFGLLNNTIHDTGTMMQLLGAKAQSEQYLEETRQRQEEKLRKDAEEFGTNLEKAAESIRLIGQYNGDNFFTTSTNVFSSFVEALAGLLDGFGNLNTNIANVGEKFMNILASASKMGIPLNGLKSAAMARARNRIPDGEPGDRASFDYPIPPDIHTVLPDGTYGPNIPGAALGDVVSRPSLRRVAEVGQTEVISPIQTLKETFREVLKESGGRQGDIIIQVDGKTLARIVGANLNESGTLAARFGGP